MYVICYTSCYSIVVKEKQRRKMLREKNHLLRRKEGEESEREEALGDIRTHSMRCNFDIISGVTVSHYYPLCFVDRCFNYVTNVTRACVLDNKTSKRNKVIKKKRKKGTVKI